MTLHAPLDVLCLFFPTDVDSRFSERTSLFGFGEGKKNQITAVSFNWKHKTYLSFPRSFTFLRSPCLVALARQKRISWICKLKKKRREKSSVRRQVLVAQVIIFIKANCVICEELGWGWRCRKLAERKSSIKMSNARHHQASDRIPSGNRRHNINECRHQREVVEWEMRG